MNLKKHRILVIGGGLALVILIVAVVLLVQMSARYRETSSSLERAQARLRSLNQRSPFPSEENVRVLEANLDLVRGEVAELKTRLSEANIEVDRIEPAQFAPLLERTYKRISDRAASLNVPIPGQGTYGYAVYAQGTLPDRDHVERLVRQAKIQEYLGGLLLEAKVSRIDLLQRTAFEDAPVETEEDQRFVRRPTRPSSGQGSPTDIPRPEPSDLYQTERFTLTFSGREGAVWDALNRLGASPLFIKVVDVSLRNLGDDIGKPVDLQARFLETRRAAAAAGQGRGAGMEVTPQVLATIPREDRIIAGRELIEAKVVLDVFLFTPGDPEPAPAEAES